MTKRSIEPASASASEAAPERRFAEELGVIGESMGMPRMVARLWGWLLICDPPQQSSSDLARALGVSRASISTATRLLVATGIARRSAMPGARGYYFEADSDAFLRLPVAERFGALRRQFEQGLELLADPDDPRGDRLRAARDFYAFVEAELPRVMNDYRLRRMGAEETGR